MRLMIILDIFGVRLIRGLVSYLLPSYDSNANHLELRPTRTDQEE
jgi:hypothetical protein